jgi:Icc-related predicted phosphoesterase
MKIDCIADLHGYLPKLEGGDLLIIAGDICAIDRIPEWVEFYAWLKAQNYRQKLYIGGNHDNMLAQTISSHQTRVMGIAERFDDLDNVEYLLDSGFEFEGLKFWGSPWTPWFPEVHPKCKAFMGNETLLKEKFDLIPDDTDILITHGPPWGMLDLVEDDNCPCAYGCKKPVGSKSLLERIWKLKLKLHVFGHIHEGYGELVMKSPGYGDENISRIINCSLMNQYYQPVNKPVRIEL